MSKVIAILNQKGGVGKTTIAANIGVSISKRGHSVLMVDSDPQGSLRDWSATSEGELLSVIGLDRETLAKDIEGVKAPYDYVIIDGRAKAEKMAGAAIRAADIVLIPVAPSALDIWGASDITEAIAARHEVTEGKPQTRFIINAATKNTKLIEEIRPATEESGFKPLDTVLYNREIYKQTMGEGLTVHDSKNPDALEEIEKLTTEIMGLLNEN
ncbi:ParA family partition ATPase [methanotrophic endosymbiont of Bathymodiolus puteoserpentis (Logatchev)]|jgi:chromosome partitioning protein|uniref:ParA family partition ATPase n=1 Tax=methanotrophic endosymbiont of Bathymodiolus puteoserpentis (Logatchev) TaxID=343235 RepID=UPI0013CAFAFF|nr:ParA family partition ATPase [methanotrophic endosymbiont of Bathymodiolus puteoserpentis (Logatchev)]SHE22866.1 Chromosome (plasmid) partitioning protein ParA [methanotrophic endosymbiont of Bathymodiolus puteoserpentis (Logatchev)]